jgi:hypothetical protein
VHNPTLQAALEAFAADAAGQLSMETARGAEVPFEVVEEPGARASLYCYRPLTGAFIRERVGLLSRLPTYTPAARALASLDGVDAYLSQRGEPRIPGEPRERADAALRSFLSQVFADRSEFDFDPERFELAYAELERALYEGRCVATVIAPLLGLALEHSTQELPIGEGLALVRGDALPDAPAEAVWGDGEEPHVLAVLTVAEERGARSPVSSARIRFRRTLTALRLFERGGYALGPLAWTRTDAGPWRPVPLGSSGRPRFVTFISAEHEDELRAFCNLIARRTPGRGEVAWALSRFEMGCERLAPFEALTDYLLALRALLESEGPASGLLAKRLAALCATPEYQAELAQRATRGIALERAAIAGTALAEPGLDALVDELSEHLRALLRDVLCGHLDADLQAVADAILADAAESGLEAESAPEPLAFPEDRSLLGPVRGAGSV